MTLEEYLTLTDEEIQFLIAYDYGVDINDPSYGSGVNTKERPDDEEEIEDEDPLDRELPDVMDSEKYEDLDTPRDLD